MRFEVDDFGFRIMAELTVVGSDVLIVLTGGDSPHIGTVTTWTKESDDMRTVNFPSHSGRFHKDHVLAEEILSCIKTVLPLNCVLTSGVHVNGITQEQIKGSFAMARDLGQQIHDWLLANPIQAAAPAYYQNGEKAPEK